MTTDAVSLKIGVASWTIANASSIQERRQLEDEERRMEDEYDR
ncbi:Uncharacterised protein [Citrobacter koseri]|uniref:Uncharacterized protein n=1 Tax=Citrobacter koseri TaxID=545 RepID=A0A2X2VJ09_CITKO|nr:Uncharacterised protein [Citrobacter koseri]